MASEGKTVSYHRREKEGTLALAGVVDIFEAPDLHQAAKRALADTKARSVVVALSELQRLDFSALQILMALRCDLEASGRGFSLQRAPAALQETLARIDFGESAL